MNSHRFFKTDIEFRRNIAMAAFGARYVKKWLEEHGHEIIELERGALSTRIWKHVGRKQRRLPDLLCLKCGQRFEVRAKSGLSIRMSHSQRRPWMQDAGLKEDDIVLFLSCVGTKESPYNFKLQLDPIFVRVKDMKDTFERGLVKVSDRKALSEGSEVYIEWPLITAPCDGRIIDINHKQIVIRCKDGKIRSLRLIRKIGEQEIKLSSYVERNREVIEGEVLASLLPFLSSTQLECRSDISVNKFLEMLSSNEFNQKYTAVRALGELLKRQHIENESKDTIIRLLRKNLQTYMVHHRADEELLLIAETYLALIKGGYSDSLTKKAEGVLLRDNSLGLEVALSLNEPQSDIALNLLDKILRSELHEEVKGTAMWSFIRGHILQNPFNEDLLHKFLDLFVSQFKNINMVKYLAETLLILLKNVNDSTKLCRKIARNLSMIDEDAKRRGFTILIWALLKIESTINVSSIVENIPYELKKVFTLVSNILTLKKELGIESKIFDDLERAYIMWEFDESIYTVEKNNDHSLLNY